MTIEQILEEFQDINLMYNNCTRYDSLKRMLEELVESIRPKGEWIKQNVGYGCSMCNLGTNKYGVDLYKFCPNCGADMRGARREDLK